MFKGHSYTESQLDRRERLLNQAADKRARESRVLSERWRAELRAVCSSHKAGVQ